MIGNVFARIAEFGQDVIVTDEKGNEVACRGFLQPEIYGKSRSGRLSRR